MEHIGQKIKSLRKKADLTQDRLAEMLGVTAQAISKWEVGSASPDLSLIAPLCRVFGVTADELLGIAHEKDPQETETEEELDRLMKTPGKNGKIDIPSLREKAAEAVKLYPDNLRIAYDYAVSLRFRIADPADGDEESKRERKRTVEEILKKIIRESDDAELKKEAYGTLVLMLAQGGRKKEALALAEEGACKDRLRFMCLEGREQIAFFQRCVHRDLYELLNFFAVGCAQIRDEAFKKGIRDAWEGILRAATPDGNYGIFSMYFDACLEGKAAQLTKEGKYEEAVACLGEIMEMWERVDSAIIDRIKDRIKDRIAGQRGQEDRQDHPALDPGWKFAYTAPLFDGLAVSPLFDRSGNTSYAEQFAKTLRMLSDFAPLEGREDYEALVGKYAPPRAEKPMTPDEFRDYLDRGLGRAILRLDRLDRAEDKAPFLAVWRDAILHPFRDVPDGQGGTIPSYSWPERSVYDRDLVERFDPSGKLGEEIAEQILAMTPPHWNVLGLVSLLGHEAEVNALFKTHYGDAASAFRKALLGEGDCPPEDAARGWMEIALRYAAVGTPKRDIIRRFLNDLAEFFRLAPERFDFLRRLFYEYSENLQGDNWNLFWDVLFEKNPLSSVLTVMETARTSVSPEEITAERILAADPNAPDTEGEWAAIRNAMAEVSDEVFFAVLDAAVAEQDPDRQRFYTEFLRGSRFRDRDKLIERAWAVFDDPKSRLDGANAVLLISLERIRDPRVRALGEKLKRSEDRVLRANGLHLMYGANFQPEDADTVEARLKDPQGGDAAWIDVINALEAGAPGVRESWLRLLYEDPYTRPPILRTLYDLGRLPDEWREESLFDANPNVRRIVRGEREEPARRGRKRCVWKTE